MIKRNDYYWRTDGNFLDKVEILNFNDTDALINALLSTQVDAIAQIPLALVEVIDADERMSILNSEDGHVAAVHDARGQEALRRRAGSGRPSASSSTASR